MTNAIVTRLMDALNRAKAAGIQSPKMKLGRFEFTLAKTMSANPGYAYITWSGTYMGKLSPDQVLTLTPQGEQYKEEILALLVDISAAASAYGRRTGNCCICGRLLTAKESVAHSIGPICADKYGLVFAPTKNTGTDIEIPDDF